MGLRAALQHRGRTPSRPCQAGYTATTIIAPGGRQPISRTSLPGQNDQPATFRPGPEIVCGRASNVGKNGRALRINELAHAMARPCPRVERLGLQPLERGRLGLRKPSASAHSRSAKLQWRLELAPATASMTSSRKARSRQPPNQIARRSGARRASAAVDPAPAVAPFAAPVFSACSAVPTRVRSSRHAARPPQPAADRCSGVP